MCRNNNKELYTKEYLLELKDKYNTWRKVADYLDITVSKLSYIRDKLNMDIKNKQSNLVISKEELINLHDKKGSWRSVARFLGYDVMSVIPLCKKYGLYTGKSYRFNEDYFENIDTNEKAYFLGYIGADGNVRYRKRKNGISKCFTIELQYKDKYILERFKEELEGEFKIHEVNAKDSHKCRIEFINNKFCNDLSKYGIEPRKNIHYEPKNIPKEFIPAFIKGFFDGDGCISGTKVDDENIYKIGEYTIATSGNRDLMVWIKNELEKLGIHCVVYQNYREGKYKNYDHFMLKITRLSSRYKFCKICSEIGIGLERKNKRYLNYVYAVENIISDERRNKIMSELGYVEIETA
jgi:hypothetical protein